MALGIVLTPFGKLPNGAPPYAIGYQYGGNGTYLGPDDPGYYGRGEAGYYHDTQLGGPRRPGALARLKRKLGLGSIPTDFEISKTRNYLPVMSGWIRTKQGYQTGPWTPPGNLEPWAAPLQPLNGLAGLGQVPAPPATVEDVMAAMTAHNDRVFALTLVSTAAVAISAMLGIFRTLRLIARD